MQSEDTGGAWILVAVAAAARWLVQRGPVPGRERGEQAFLQFGQLVFDLPEPLRTAVPVKTTGHESR
jgi:hypothetical protein